ncbi:MAG: bifunctional (p)ppGpp synthetase/guanosine-3',5'-bis(diphosphate) 3'-pyrophosphohydrolase [Thiothrix sp.]|nr:bifunctional (p)ppGpp synthetase/guanosine-3',5'-bis(diphosphate) 3'-pyrophosphohydrolase [Thiothrix sp.]HPQ95699.1 HD domain-containing protein [Thiolinea sp.]
MTQWTQKAYQQAWQYAAAAHAGQTYSSPSRGVTLPYITHIAGVTLEVIRAMEDGDAYDGDLAVQCALLHDTIEDTASTWQEVADLFGTAVADGVSALSKSPAIRSKQGRMADSLERIRLQPREVWMVKLADRINNLSEPPCHWNGAKRREYRGEARLILTRLGAAHAGLAQRLQARIEDYARYLE